MCMQRVLTTMVCAGALALALAACGGGDGGGSSDSGRADAQRAIVDAAIDSARAAVGVLSDSSSGAALAAAEGAVAAAKTAVVDAGDLSADEKRAYETAIDVIEGILDAVRPGIVTALAQEPERLSAALAGTRITGIAAVVRHGAAPAMSGTVPGTPPAAVAGLETAAAGVASTVDGWLRGVYAAADEAAGIEDRVVLYTNVEADGAMPFGGEGGKYDTANGLDAAGNLPIVAGTDATLIASPAFPTGSGIRTHAADGDDPVEIAGTFDGAAGNYVCAPPAGGACTSSVRAGGGIDLAGGWTFVPAADAVVVAADAEHQYFGWGLRKAGNAYAVGVFHAGAGAAADEFADLAALQGTATYRGPAAGQFAVIPQIGAASAGAFTATAALEVDFGGAADAGAVTGTVDGFTVEGEAMPWSVELGAAQIFADGRIAAGAAGSAATVWTVDGRAAANSATWSAHFHDVNADRVPTVATGTFEALYDDVGRLTGAFGTTLQ